MQKSGVKKVLVIGGGRQMVEIIEAAKKRGICTIIADHAVGAPAQKYADRFYAVSPSNHIKLAEIGKAEQLDGISAVFDDVTTWNALALCKSLNVPFYAAKEQLESLPNREKFLDYCRTFNVSVIDENALAGTVEETDGTVLEIPFLLSSYAGKVYAAI